MTGVSRFRAVARPVDAAARLPSCAAALWLCLATPLFAQDSPSESTDTPAVEAESEIVDLVGNDPLPDPCDIAPRAGNLPERTQSVVHSMACHTARWADGLFGDDEDFPEERVNGMMSVGLAWSEYDKFDPTVRFRLNTELPNLNSRVNAFLGRVDEDAYVSDSEVSDEAFPSNLNRNDETSWLLGLGYRKNPEERNGFDYSVGVRLRAPPDPYAKVRYEFFRDFSRSDFRFQQTIFWRLDEGLGTTSKVDTAWDLGGGHLLRNENFVRVSEETEGVNWYTGTTWYQHLGNHRGLALLAFARGETDEPVGLQEYGFRLTWRQEFLRDWMFIEMGPTLTWPREKLEERREASFGFGALVEMEFGGYRRY